MRRFSTKSDSEKEQEEADRLRRKSPEKKPPRHDKQRNRVDVEDDDLDNDDDDLSLNYKDIGGHINNPLVNSRYIDKASYTRGSERYPVTGKVFKTAVQSAFKKAGLRTSAYRGLPGPLDKDDPYKPPSPKWRLPESAASLTFDDFTTIIGAARKWLREPYISEVLDEDADMACRMALDFSVHSASDHKYNGSVDSPTYQRLLGLFKRIESEAGDGLL